MAQTEMLNVALLKLFKETLLMKTDASSGLLLKVRLFNYYASILKESARQTGVCCILDVADLFSNRLRKHYLRLHNKIPLNILTF